MSEDRKKETRNFSLRLVRKRLKFKPFRRWAYLQHEWLLTRASPTSCHFWQIYPFKTVDNQFTGTAASSSPTSYKNTVLPCTYACIVNINTCDTIASK